MSDQHDPEHGATVHEDDNRPPFIALTLEQFESMVELCENPPQPTPALVEARRAHKAAVAEGRLITDAEESGATLVSMLGAAGRLAPRGAGLTIDLSPTAPTKAHGRWRAP